MGSYLLVYSPNIYSGLGGLVEARSQDLILDFQCGLHELNFFLLRFEDVFILKAFHLTEM